MQSPSIFVWFGNGLGIGFSDFFLHLIVKNLRCNHPTMNLYSSQLYIIDKNGVFLAHICETSFDELAISEVLWIVTVGTH